MISTVDDNSGAYEAPYFFPQFRFKGFQYTPTMVGLGIPLKAFIGVYRHCRIDVYKVGEMFKPKSVLDYAISKAREIPVTKSDSGKPIQRIYAVCVDKSGRVLSESSNMYDKSHPYQYECACAAGREEAIMLHAEIAAIVRNKRNIDIHRIVVARVGNTGKPLLAKPCSICQIAIDLHGIPNVEYTKNP